MITEKMFCLVINHRFSVYENSLNLMLVSYQIGAQKFLTKKEFDSEKEDLTVCHADLTKFEFKMLKVRLKISFLQN